MFAIDTANLHPSTEACLEVLQWLEQRRAFGNILEIGCGNGILSLAAVSIWDAKGIAADISPKAVADTQAQIEAYGLSGQLKTLRSDGFSHPDIVKNAPYDLIIANLLAELQARIALDIKKYSNPGGYILLSGILAWKALETIQAFTGLGFEIAHKIEKSPWITYILCHITDTIEKPPFTKA